MSDRPPIRIAFGTLCHDEAGKRWVCTGSRVTTVGTRSYHFTQEHNFVGTPWTYQATEPATLRRKFPDLVIVDE